MKPQGNGSAPDDQIKPDAFDSQADSQGLPDDANDSQLEEGELPIGSYWCSTTSLDMPQEEEGCQLTSYDQLQDGFTVTYCDYFKCHVSLCMSCLTSVLPVSHTASRATRDLWGQTKGAPSNIGS